ncbi:MAG TPA: GntG family PLP-dependent aldolase [Vicinamibacteria bacterium]|nr:GntG family PLP-dependent aldolase [Vicinamibacteria bacterium]
MPIDLRSDTMTHPTPAMRRAMSEAEVGDDLWGEDPTVNRLQAKAAALLGFEAALYVPTGTMANEIAIRLLARPGQLVLADARSHVIEYELAGMAALSGAMPMPVSTSDGKLTPGLLRAGAKPWSVNRPEVGMVVLENTHNLGGGTLATPPEMRDAIATAHELGWKVHVDGARLWNAAVALGCEPRELATGADTAMVALSKGLCCPIGSLLVASAERIAEARRIRSLFGGGWRQAGIVAAAGLLALDTMIPRLSEDHAHARLLADALGQCSGVQTVPPQTNIVVGQVESGAAAAAAKLAERGVLASAMDRSTLRFVTHHDVSRDDCLAAAAAIREALA